MVAIKSHQADAYLKSLDRRVCAVLFFGTDAGLVVERSQALARLVADRQSPAGEVLRFADEDLDADPDRLAVELQTTPLFGGQKIIRATAGRRVNANALKPLLDGPPLAGFLIVEAGNQKPDDALRVLFEKSDRAAAVACYGDEGRDLEGVVRSVLAAEGLQITSEARALLVDRLGADRVLSRSEIEKLALYAAGKGTIDADDVDAVVADASELTLDRVVLATMSGDAQRALEECDRAVGAGESAHSVLGALLRHVQRLHRLRGAIDGGRSFDDAARSLRPPLHFKQKDAIQAQCRHWSAARLLAAGGAIQNAIKATRSGTLVEMALVERLLLDLARAAGGGGDSRPVPPGRAAPSR